MYQAEFKAKLNSLSSGFKYVYKVENVNLHDVYYLLGNEEPTLPKRYAIKKKWKITDLIKQLENDFDEQKSADFLYKLKQDNWKELK